MDGSVVLSDLLVPLGEPTIQRIKDHSKYVVRVAWSESGRWWASIGYDKLVCVYEQVEDVAGNDQDVEGEPLKVSYVRRFSKSLQSNPEAILFTPGDTHLVYTRRDDVCAQCCERGVSLTGLTSVVCWKCFLHYISLPTNSGGPSRSSTSPFETTPFNINENDDLHVSFSVSV
jgi:hypothetical protein